MSIKGWQRGIKRHSTADAFSSHDWICVHLRTKIGCKYLPHADSTVTTEGHVNCLNMQCSAVFDTVASNPQTKHCAWSVLTSICIEFSSTFMPLQCKSCKSYIGRIYRTTPRELDHLRYTFECLHVIRSTVVWCVVWYKVNLKLAAFKTKLMLKHCLLWLCQSIFFYFKQMFLSTNNSFLFFW